MIGRVARGVLALGWLALVLEALFVAPGPRPDQAEWVGRLLTGAWAGEEPSVVATFQLLGVWPLAMGALLAPWLARRPVPLWPFVVLSMGFGAFALVPGLVLGGREPGPDGAVRWLRHPVFVGGLALGAILLIGWGVLAGDPGAYAEAFATSSLVHVMTLDFVLLWVTSVVVARAQGGPWGLTVVPLLGALAWVIAVGSARTEAP